MKNQFRSCANQACDRLTEWLGGASRFCCGPCASAFKDLVEVYNHLPECDTLAKQRDQDRGL